MSSLYSEFDRWLSYRDGYAYAKQYYVKYRTEVLLDMVRALRLVNSSTARGIVRAICEELRKRREVAA